MASFISNRFLVLFDLTTLLQLMQMNNYDKQMWSVKETELFTSEEDA